MNLDFNILMDTAIRLNSGARPNPEGFPLREYSTSFCTIRIDPGRVTGKTYWIKRHAKKGELVIVYNEEQVHEYREFEGFSADILTMPSAVTGKKLKYPVIYIDEPVICATYADPEEFLSNIDYSCRPDFILLG